MLRWVRAFENNSMNVNLAQAGARVKSDSFGDHYKLTASHSTSTSWLTKGHRAADGRRHILCSAIISTPPETERAYPLYILHTPEQDHIVGFGPMDNLEFTRSAFQY